MRRAAPVPTSHHAIRAEARRRERWRDLAAALAVIAVVLVVSQLLPPG
jgi:hypothetical protein